MIKKTQQQQTNPYCIVIVALCNYFAGESQLFSSLACSG